MRQFDYTKKWKKMLTPEIVRYLTTIHEYKGEQRLIAEHHADVLLRWLRFKVQRVLIKLRVSILLMNV